VDLGFLISFSGIVTFRNAAALRETARALPIERILVETDSPYLAPVPHRGKPNQPAFVRFVAEEIARMRRLEFAAVAEATTRNFAALFKPPGFQ
jgi:TatD DNase family protein